MAAFGDGPDGRGGEPLGRLVEELEATVAAACERQVDWPERIAAGIYAGVDFAAAHPLLVDAIPGLEGRASRFSSDYEKTVERLAGFIARDSPASSRLPGTTDEALVAGIVGLVGDHVRVGRIDALLALRPDLVLLALLPYLGFDEARRWANEFAKREVDH